MLYNVNIKDKAGNILLGFENIQPTITKTAGFYVVDNSIVENKVITFDLITDKAIANELVEKLNEVINTEEV